MDQLPKIVYHHQDWNWKDLNSYYTWKYGKPVKPVQRRSECDIPEDCTCPACKARAASTAPWLDAMGGTPAVRWP